MSIRFADALHRIAPSGRRLARAVGAIAFTCLLGPLLLSPGAADAQEGGAEVLHDPALFDGLEYRIERSRSRRVIRSREFSISAR